MTEEKEGTWVHTNCGMCYACCGIKIKVVDGVMVKVEGEPDSDMGSSWGLCGKGAACLQQYYDPNRINYPLKRTNPKKGLHEDPRWQRISWDEALDTIMEKLAKVREENPWKVLFATTPSGGVVGSCSITSTGFWNAFGTPNFAHGGAALYCGNGAHFGAGLLHASWSICPDFKYCNYTLQFGSNKGTGSGHGAAEMMRLAAEARVRGMRNIVFDPICNFGGGKATEWIPILPGTDLAVALAMCNIIVNEIGVYDEEFIREYTNGPYLVGLDMKFVRDKESGKTLLWDVKGGGAKSYDDPGLSTPALEGEFTVNGVKCHPAFQLLREHLKKYPAKWASEVSSVPENTIRRIANEWVQEARIGSTIEIEGVKLPFRPVAAVSFRGGQGHTNSFHQYLSVCLLNVLVGNLDVPGGALGWPARSLGHPVTGRPKFEPYAGVDGMITPQWWIHHPPWPTDKPRWPEKPRVSLQDIFVHTSIPAYPYAADFDEIWTKAGRPYEIEVMAVLGANIAKTVTDSKSIERFLASIPFIFDIEIMHNETTEGFCDIVLPDCHFLETSSAVRSQAYGVNYPTGMRDWSFHINVPVVEPQYERRNHHDVFFELADRLDIKAKFNNWMDAYATTDLVELLSGQLDKRTPLILELDEKISNAEYSNRMVKYLFGSEHDLKWFREHGVMKWKKRVEEAYWRTFIKARVPIYFEFLVHDKEPIKEMAEALGIHMNWDYYTPLLSYFPSVIYEEGGPEHDLVAFSYRDTLHAGTMTAELPWINELSEANPYTYNIAMNMETAKKKGLHEGDIICAENTKGMKMKGRLKLMKGIHPGVVGTVGSLGSWARGKPIALGKGPHFNDLIIMDQKHICPVSGNLETAVRVKVYKDMSGKGEER